MTKRITMLLAAGAVTFAATAQDIVDEWNCGAVSDCEAAWCDGSHIKCSLDSEGTLTVRKIWQVRQVDGMMRDYGHEPCMVHDCPAVGPCPPQIPCPQPPPPWYGRNTIATVVIDSGITYIGNNAFLELSGLTTVKIGSSVAHIGEGAFALCASLTSVISLNTEPPLTTPAALCINFDGGPCGTFAGSYFETLYVPTEGVDNYKASSSWQYDCSNIRPLSEHTSISHREITTTPRAAPRATVRDRTLSITSSPGSVSHIRLIDMRGKTVARYNAGAAPRGRPLSFTLTNIPAGRYFVEMRDGVKRDRMSVVVGVR